MANYVALTALDGTTVSINPEEVAALTAVPASLLPTGTPAGTYVQSEDGTRVAVAGTVAAVVLLLAVGGLSSSGIFDGATGATVRASAGVTCVRNGAGDYTITFPLITNPLAMVSVFDAAAHIVSIHTTSGTTADVLTFTDAGVADDVTTFAVQFFPVV